MKSGFDFEEEQTKKNQATKKKNLAGDSFFSFLF